MSSASDYFGVVVVLSFLGFLIYGFSIIIRAQLKSIFDYFDFHFHHNINGKMRNRYEVYLLNKFSYYDKLSPPLKIKFLLRVKDFIAAKTFEKKGDFEITDEMKTLIAASAIQVSFGLDEYLFESFETILIFPESYYSNITKHYHRGEINLNGTIIFSWKDLLDGYENPTDTYNVGLHEMAHALDFENKMEDGDFDFYFGNYYDKWALIANEEYENLQNDRASFLRKYAGTNRREFFAVCVEHFFEATEEFKEKLPQIYLHLCILLKQDPLNEDFKILLPAQKSFEKMLWEVESSIELFNSRIIYKINTFFLSAIFITYFILMAVFMNYFELNSIFFYLLLFLIVPAYFLIFANRIIVYDKYIVIKDVSKKVRNVFAIEDMVSVHFKVENFRGGTTSSMEILYIENGRLYMKEYFHLWTDEKILELKRLLKPKNVPVMGSID